MATLLELVILAVFYFALAGSTTVRNCLESNPESQLEVELSACSRLPCVLKKNTTLFLHVRFIPDHQVTQLKHSVYANIGGITMPFLGVDRTPACEYVHQEDEASEQGCPLAAGTTYAYNYQFDILPAYPSVNFRVHWALQDVELQQDVVCFEIQAKITQ